MQGLRGTGLLNLLEERVVGSKVPLLGICVGAQMLGAGSEEGQEPGLGWLPMSVKRFPAVQTLKVPHMGWADVTPTSEFGESLLAEGEESRFYFVHSYFITPSDESLACLTAEHGVRFAAGVHRGNITGVQFHPEKSHRFGKHLLAAWARS